MEDLEKPSFSLKRFLFGKINRKLIGVFLIINIIPIILFGIILLSIIAPSANQVSSDVEIGLKQITHESTSFDVDILKETIEGQLEDYLFLFQSIMLDKEFYETLREADDSGTISDDRFYPADRSGNWFYLNNQFKETYEIMRGKIDMIRLFHKNGYIVNGIVLGEEDTSDYKGDKSWFEKVMNPLEVSLDSYYISPISIARRTDSSAIRYAAPIEESGKRLGLFIINFKANAITGKIESFSLGESGSAMLIDLNYKNAEGEVSPWPVILSQSVDEGVYLINESEGVQAPLGKDDLEDSSGEVDY